MHSTFAASPLLWSYLTHTCEVKQFHLNFVWEQEMYTPFLNNSKWHLLPLTSLWLNNNCTWSCSFGLSSLLWSVFAPSLSLHVYFKKKKTLVMKQWKSPAGGSSSPAFRHGTSSRHTSFKPSYPVCVSSFALFLQ